MTSVRIRDPIHGSIPLSFAELQVVDHRVFQRLRGIKQLGFTDQAFPGATHTRYAHGLGAMAVATQMFDGMFPEGQRKIPPGDRARLRQITRLAALLHDVGHPPGSHSSECAMPARSALGLDCFTEEELSAQASHEDYTLKLLLDSPLAQIINKEFARDGVDARSVVHVISGRFPERGDRFVVDGIDYFPLLTQIVSGEMDADRMDYLQRDSFFAGVSYGKFDQPWLLENLSFHIDNDRAFMALSHRAVFAFEDFLLSRYHMFVSVYYHYIAVGFDTMLVRFYKEAPDDFVLPTSTDAYVATDDVAMWSALRRSDNRWAKRIAARQAFRRVLELNADTGTPNITEIEAALTAEDIEHFVSRDKGVLSKYYRTVRDRPIFVINNPLKQIIPIDQYSPIYERYAQPAKLVRVYAAPEDARRARKVVRNYLD